MIENHHYVAEHINLENLLRYASQRLLHPDQYDGSTDYVIHKKMWGTTAYYYLSTAAQFLDLLEEGSTTIDMIIRITAKEDKDK